MQQDVGIVNRRKAGMIA